MWRVELRALDQEDIVLEEMGAAEALGIVLTPVFSTLPLEVHCELSKNGEMVLARGWVKGEMRLCCDRCLAEFISVYKSFFEIHYRPKPESMAVGDEEDFDGEVETVYFEGEAVDLAEQIRETVLLSAPMRVVCRDDCRGLCDGCGADLNSEACRCGAPPADNRWSALKNWKP